MNVRNELPLFDEVNNELARLDLYTHASETHGAICGYLCANVGESFEYWFSNILLQMSNEALDESEDAADIAVEHAQLLRQLFDATLDQLDDSDCGLRLVLPDDDEHLNERVDALAEWCHGFLYGLTVAGADQIGQYSAESQEVIRDLVKISQSGLDSGDDEQEDESAFAEIVEYVRIGVLLVWTDSQQLQREESAPTLH